MLQKSESLLRVPSQPRQLLTSRGHLPVNTKGGIRLNSASPWREKFSFPPKFPKPRLSSRGSHLAPAAAIGGAMVFLQRSRPVNPRKRPPPPPDAEPPGPSGADPGPSSAVDAAAALLADAGCTLLVPPHQAPLLPSPHAFAARLGRALSADPSAAPRLLAGVAAFASASAARLRQLLLPSAPHAPSLARALLSVPALQPDLLAMLLEKLPEYFDDDGGALDGLPLQDDVGRLIVSQFRWLDFLVDADAFVEKLVEVLSVAPPRLKKEIIGSLPEIVGDQSHAAVVVALEKLLQEDSEVVVAVLDVLSDLNLNDELQEQVMVPHFFFSSVLHVFQGT